MEIIKPKQDISPLVNECGVMGWCDCQCDANDCCHNLGRELDNNN